MTERIVRLGDELYAALRARTVVPPLLERHPDLTLDEAWAISNHLLARRLADGERVIGRKIGVTSEPVQRMLGVFEPDFGWLTDVMQCDRVVPVSTAMIQPRAEAEIAVVLAADLPDPDTTPEQVRSATATVHAAVEVVDSRVRDWKIRIQDTVADNASSGMFVLGEGVAPQGVDLELAEVTVLKNGVFVSSGFGTAALGSPWNSAAWLARTVARRGVPLRAGEVLLTGSLVPLEPVCAGDVYVALIPCVGRVEVHFQ